MFCKKCGSPIKNEYNYCIRCGASSSNLTESSEVQVMPLDELESLRKKIVKKQITGYVIGILIILLFLIIFGKTRINLAPFIAVTVLILVQVGTVKDKSLFRKAYKNMIVLESLKKMFSDICYEPNKGIGEHILSNTAMIHMGNRYYSNDYISGKYKNIPFIASDVHIQDERRDSDGDTYTVTLFKGQWFIFDFNKSFKADIQICEKGFGNNKRTIFGENRMKKVELEDIDFNKQFNVYAQNELDAFYILTPNTMEKIKEVENKVSGSLLFCFIDNKLHVGLYNRKDLFEYKNIYKSINLEEEKNNVLKDMKNITEFVDILDLDNDLFRREN